jgi:pimeloyl-ACP methyl ester carboxylesterase
MERTMTGKPTLGQSMVRVPVDGGELAVGVLGEQDDAAPTVIAVHGITASHRSWLALARALPGVRVIAPDLRGRGRSNQLLPPYGLRQHAIDVERIHAHFGLEAAPIVGHSMGAFVSVLFGARAPEQVSRLVLVDGGIPLPPPEGLEPDELPSTLLGPAAERLAMTFPRVEDYRDFWRRHPAFAQAWGDDVQDYVDYDLSGQAPELRPSAAIDAVLPDSMELYGPAWYLDALRSLRMPVVMLRAPRDLLDRSPGLYPPGPIEAAREVPQLRVIDVDDVNHYTIIMAERGAARVAAEVRAAIAAPKAAESAVPVRGNGS